MMGITEGDDHYSQSLLEQILSLSFHVYSFIHYIIKDCSDGLLPPFRFYAINECFLFTYKTYRMDIVRGWYQRIIRLNIHY